MEPFKEFAALLARKSAEVIRPYFRSGVQVSRKQDDSPVTVADRKAEEVMRELIMKYYPDFGIIGEEFGTHNPNAQYKWVLDPIDGTKSFICGALSFGTLIALVRDGQPILGVINHPILDQFLIGDNESAKLNGEPVKIRPCGDLSQAVLLTTDHLNIAKYQDREKFDRLTERVALYRNWGDCYGYYLVATGYADVMIDPVMSVWDTMAVVPIIRGAGGIVTDYSGADPVTGNSLIAAGKSLHPLIISALS